MLAFLFTYLALKKKSIAASALPFLMAVLLLLELGFHVPVLSGAVEINAENIIVEIHPTDMEQEIIFSAHYDSKTEPFDHHLRNLLISASFLIAGLWVAVTIWRWYLFRGTGDPPASVDIWQKIIICCMLGFWILVGFAFGGGVLLQPSPGAVDNAASVTALMLLAVRNF